MKTTLGIPENLIKRTIKLSKSKTKTKAIIMPWKSISVGRNYKVLL